MTTVLSKLKNLIDDNRLLTTAAELDHYGKDWTTAYTANPLAIAFPKTIEELCQLVHFANQERIQLVPSGGRTGLSGGAMATNQELVVAFDKMNKLIEIDQLDQTITVQAGMITQQLQELAEEHGLYYPVDFASSGSSQIGGNIATNAGGIKVIRHGLTRDQVVGLKVVTGKGEVLDLNKGLIKNATGYDLRHLFIGSEGTLGFIAEATIRLSRRPKPSVVLLLSIENYEKIMQVFAYLRQNFSLNAFEFFSDKALNHVLNRIAKKHPFSQPSEYYTLIELECDNSNQENLILQAFEHCIEQQWIDNGVISQNESQAKQLWQFRELISETISIYSPFKNDISVRPSKIPNFLRDVENAVTIHYPDFEIIWFGHIGDGNVHLNILKPNDLDKDQFLKHCYDVNNQVMNYVQSYGGSISAEHGIGLLKKHFLPYTRSTEEIAYMKSIKSLFDPNNIMNPGKVL